MKGTMTQCKDFKIWTPDEKCAVRQATTIANTIWGISLVMSDTNEKAERDIQRNSYNRKYSIETKLLTINYIYVNKHMKVLL